MPWYGTCTKLKKKKKKKKKKIVFELKSNISPIIKFIHPDTQGKYIFKIVTMNFNILKIFSADDRCIDRIII